MKKIYIAGFDVFKQNSIQIGQTYSVLCKKYDYEGLYPLDNVVDFNQSKQKIAQDIYKANVELIHQSDIVIANLNQFRGKEADSGTIWECGYAKALGKDVYGYMQNNQSYLDSFNENEKYLHNSAYVDNDNMIIEDFDYSINLMIACSVEKIIFGNFEDVLKYINNK
ncbi:nucleoside 2-deoxyribosyltransferase [Arcobacter nitrofigilis DSM 7299]|uniref:Nucleoside 2-deoxyribosyltransferase n=1 Tax=Arcobacter nitrofigilis (strain ATCC 33309 / DSM 7299 / CCUG 15893 / LMG 7604 / NCTC 12251 / CI) TaxID=572480 RepID=D5UZW8_ARCNC|nr:nucleoside 2-deoxyribosyltransferase [Arcobacter nitrofigilis]ADG93337.1 nucleoside 2-deoxyribosyltransferase [Arcobacter nitrofigilis DSM 7299]